MLSFMFCVLGSTIFWVSFFLVGFIVGSMLLKHVAPLSWETIKTGERPRSRFYSSLKADKACIILAIISVYSLWPLILFGYVFYLVAKNVAWPVFRKAVISSGSIIPDIEIKSKKE